MLRFLLTSLFLVLAVLADSHGREATFAFEVAVEAAGSAADKKRATLFDKYATAVERVQAELQADGDLANALKARDVARKAKEQRVLGSSDLPALKKLRGVMEKELGKIRLAEAVEISSSRETYIGKLGKEADALTRAGKLDEAVALSKTAKAETLRLEADRDRIAALESKGKPGGGLRPKPPLTRPADDAPAKLVETPFTGKEPVTGELTLEPGTHRLKNRVTIGIRGFNKKLKKEEEIPGIITTGAGTEISGGEIYLHCGKFLGSKTRFEKVRISEELQGKWTLESCLLDDCTFHKDGGWWAGEYAAGWDFENCVFEGSFFEKWDQTGLKVFNCSFHGIKFHPFDYKKDAGKEATSKGRRLIGCLFEDCTVPASFALATEGCLFRNCKFTRDMGEEPKVDTEIETVLYYDGYAEPEAPKLPEGARIVFKPASELGEKKAGADLRYTHTRGKLQFE